MSEADPHATQRDATPGIVAELESAGFDDALEIGRGGFGVVYRCVQRSLDRTVAIKVLIADSAPGNVERFLREQRAMGRLSGHPHTVEILHVDTTGTGRPYIVMPYHVRGSLESLIRREGPLDHVSTLRIGVKLAGALEAAHRVGILHRDVKPGNVLFTEYGEPQLTDFGIARIAGGFETATGEIAGSPAFTSPEVLAGSPATPASDVYGLGATLFSGLTGHAAFERRSGEKLVTQFLRITTKPIEWIGPSVPRELRAAIETAMARDPADRHKTAADFGDILRGIERGEGVSVDDMVLPGDRATGDGPPRPSTDAPGNDRLSSAPVTPSSHPTPPAPATKFRPPIPSRQLVRRNRLIETLRAGGRRRLTVIHGPPGFGKSTLAAQWADDLAGDVVSVAWLTVDNDDNTVVWFLAHLVEAIRRVRPTLANELGQALEEHGDDAVRYVLTSLINQIHVSGERVAVVIDDWHRVTSSEVIAALDFLLEHGCHHLQVVVTSRSQSGLPMSKMRVADELIEVDAVALKFSLIETTSFLEDKGLGLGSDDIDHLMRTTEGWVAALQLVSLSLRAHNDPSTLISHISGRHHAIAEFLAENVLDTLDPTLLDFLLATSVTERTCGALASTLAEVDRGQALLEEVEDRDLFLRSLDEEREWFRYHQLFAEFLRRRLIRDQPERVPGLHLRASQWFAERLMVREAVDHALAAGDSERAVTLVETHGMYLLERSQMSTLLALVAKLPAQVTAKRPHLQIAVVSANVLLRRTREVHAALGNVESALEQLPTPEAADLRVEADVLKAVESMFADRIEGVEPLVAECLRRPETLPQWVVSAAADVASFVSIYRFEFAAARSRQEWASAYQSQSNGPFGVMYGLCLSGIAAHEQLELAAAERSFRLAREVAQTVAEGRSDAARLAGALLGELLYEIGEIDEAEELLDASYESGPAGGIADFMIATYVSGARVKALRGDSAAALARLDDGARAAEVADLPRVAACVDGERIRLGVGPHPLQLPTPPQLKDIGTERVTEELREANRIREVITVSPPAHADDAARRAHALVEGLKAQDRPRALLLAEILAVECLIAAGHDSEARKKLVELLSRCARFPLIGPFLDSGPSVMTLVAALRDDRLQGRWPPGWPSVPDRFLELLTSQATSEASDGGYGRT